MSPYLSTLVQVAEEHSSNSTFYAWLTGAVTLAIFLGLMLALMSFGGGREHS
jgi:hypothetical protein